MDHHGKIQFRDPEAAPTRPMLEQALGGSYAAYETFQDNLPHLDVEQVWQWYTPHKVWSARGQHWWTTSRGTNKEKTLYWLNVFEGYFCVAIWFKEKNREEILKADVSEETKQLIRDANTMGKLPTFPVMFNVATSESLADIYVMLECKKKLER